MSDGGTLRPFVASYEQQGGAGHLFYRTSTRLHNKDHNSQVGEMLKL